MNRNITSNVGRESLYKMNENRAADTHETEHEIALPKEASVEHMPHSERHPNLTLLETGQNPGDILRSAREKAGLSLAEISAQTKINERLLAVLESGDMANMPPETFAKAFIKSYCKALHMDSMPVILSFGFVEGSQSVKMVSEAQVEMTMTRIESNEPKMPKASRRLNTLSFDKRKNKSIGYLVVLAGLGLLAAFYLPVFLGGAEKMDAATDVPAVAISEPASGTEPLNVEAPSTALPNEQSGPAVADQPKMEEPTPNSDPVDASAPFPSLQQPLPSAGAPSVSAPAVSPPSVPGKQSVLKLSFEGPSWVTVKDATDQVLISRMHESKGNLELKGQAPFKVILGDAKVVKLFNNDKPIDVAAAARQGKVARLTVQ